MVVQSTCIVSLLYELSMQHTNDFALYTEAIKFFNHSESMVRIAVRTITLNVYRGKKLQLHAVFYTGCSFSKSLLLHVHLHILFVLCVVFIFCLCFLLKDITRWAVK